MMQKTLVLLLCFSLSSASWAGLPIEEVPESYGLELDPNDDDTILVSTCGRLISGLPERCRSVATMSVADMEAFGEQMAEEGELAEEGRTIALSGIMLLMGEFFVATALPPQWARSLISHKIGGPMVWVLTGLAALAVVGGVVVFLAAPSRDYETGSMRIRGKTVKSLFTEFVNQHGEAVAD